MTDSSTAPFARACWILLGLIWLSAGLGSLTIRLMISEGTHAGWAMTLLILAACTAVLTWFGLRAAAGLRGHGHPFGRWLVGVLARPRALAAAAALSAVGFMLPRSAVENSSWIGWAVDAAAVAAVVLITTGIAAAVFRNCAPDDPSELPPD